MTREDRTWLIVLIVLSGFSLAVAFHYGMAMYLGRPYPASTFLFDPRDFANDFFNILAPVKAGTPYASPLSVYFPFTFVPLWLVRGLPGPLLYVALVGTLVAVSLWWVGRGLPALPAFQRPVALVVLALLTYPVLFCIDRGNLEILVFAALCGFLWCLQHERWLAAAAWLAAATAMKAYPGVFVVLLLARRQYRAVGVYAALTLLLSIGSAALFPGGVEGSFSQLSRNLSHFNAGYIVGNLGLPFNSSYFGLLKLGNLALHLVPRESVGALVLPYAVLCLLAFAALAALLIYRGGALWQHVALLTFVMLLFPQVSFDYKLVHLLLPLALFLAAAPGRRDALNAALLGLLLVPKAYLWIGGQTSIAVVLNPLLMSVLGGSLLRECWRAGPAPPLRTSA